MSIRQAAAEKLVRQLLELRLYRTEALSDEFVSTIAKIVIQHVAMDEQAQLYGQVQQRDMEPK